MYQFVLDTHAAVTCFTPWTALTDTDHNRSGLQGMAIRKKCYSLQSVCQFKMYRAGVIDTRNL